MGWQLTLPQYPVIAQGDQHRLYQVMINLLANARTHTLLARRCIPRFRSSARKRLSRTDNGPGIPPEVSGRSSGLPG